MVLLGVVSVASFQSHQAAASPKRHLPDRARIQQQDVITMNQYCGTILAVIVTSALYGCSASQPAAAPVPFAKVAPWAADVTKAPQYTFPGEENLRLPLPSDTGVAWDEISHRGDMRWDCRAVPSGKFVMNSLCANEPKVDSRWPGTAPPPSWDGMVHLD